jgi:ATP-dependent Clp protease ATP-binding subunit ClpB
LAEMILGGDVMDGDVIKVSAGVDGLIVGNRVATSSRIAPPNLPLH